VHSKRVAVCIVGEATVMVCLASVRRLRRYSNPHAWRGLMRPRPSASERGTPARPPAVTYSVGASRGTGSWDSRCLRRRTSSRSPRGSTPRSWPCRWPRASATPVPWTQRGSSGAGVPTISGNSGVARPACRRAPWRPSLNSRASWQSRRGRTRRVPCEPMGPCGVGVTAPWACWETAVTFPRHHRSSRSGWARSSTSRWGTRAPVRSSPTGRSCVGVAPSRDR
jgi:hypothetical protein